MKIIIRLRGRMTSVEVSENVHEYLQASKRKTENLFHEQRRHWDARAFDEYIIMAEGSRLYFLTPEQIVYQKETVDRIMSVLECCTKTQRERFLLHALTGMSFSEIAKYYGCSKVAVYESVQTVRKKCQLFLK